MPKIKTKTQNVAPTEPITDAEEEISESLEPTSFKKSKAPIIAEIDEVEETIAGDKEDDFTANDDDEDSDAIGIDSDFADPFGDHWEQ